MKKPLKKCPIEEVRAKYYQALAVFDDYCRTHQINYSLAFGSLIGAVREKRIIPWDTDIDVWMDREDYERFSLAKDYDPAYEIVTYHHPKHLSCFEIRVKIKGLYFCPTGFSRFRPKEMYVAIDVFEIDSFSCPVESIAKICKKTTRLERILSLKHPNYATTNRWTFLLHEIVRFLLLPISNKHLQKKHKRIVDSIYDQNGKNEFFPSTCPPKHGFGIMEKGSYCSNTVRATFGPIQAQITTKHDPILRQLYGDYMIPIDKNKGRETYFFLKEKGD